MLAKKERISNFVISFRPLTLWAAVCPVLIASMQSLKFLSAHQYLLVKFTTNWFLLMILALFVAIFLQIGVNYANDYFDNQHGIFPKTRPIIDTQIAKKRMYFSFSIAAIFGIIFVLNAPVSQIGKIVLICIGLLCVLAAYFYSGTPINYAAKGFGDLVSGLFFGPICICSLFFTLSVETIDLKWWVIIITKSISLGLIVSGMMMLDNIRDIKTDPELGKNTLQSKIGYKNSVRLYSGTIILSMVLMLATITIYLITIALFMFLLVLVAFQSKNLKENKIEKCFSYNVSIGIVSSLIMLF